MLIFGVHGPLNFLFLFCVFVCILPEKAVPKMTYTVSGGTLNSHSLTHSLLTVLADGILSSS